ncbi:hypothetical protein Q8A73_018119 [Channa argus]|nr:hypothetical protein Q8A73_018119 [Channa argus]
MWSVELEMKLRASEIGHDNRAAVSLLEPSVVQPPPPQANRSGETIGRWGMTNDHDKKDSVTAWPQDETGFRGGFFAVCSDSRALQPASPSALTLGPQPASYHGSLDSVWRGPPWKVSVGVPQRNTIMLSQSERL